MSRLLVIPAFLSMLVLGAHFVRAGSPGVAALCAAAPLLLLSWRRWALFVNQGLLVAGAVIWVSTALRIRDVRVAMGAPYQTALVILGAVAVFALVSAALLAARPLRARFR